MQLEIRHFGAVILSAVALAALAGCTAPQPNEFSREQTEADRLSVSPEDDPGVALDSTRFAGTTGDFRIYIARSSADGGICGVAVRADDEEWVSTGCSQGDGVGLTLQDGTQIEVGSFRFPDAGDRVPLSESVSVVQ
jgi:hypothetical protein